MDAFSVAIKRIGLGLKCVCGGGEGGREGVAEGRGQVAKNGLLPSLKKDRKISAFSTCVLGHQAAILLSTL